MHLLVFPGFWSPAWALQGAVTDRFKVQYGPGAGQCLPLPMPWDPVYLGNWFAFVKQLGDRYGDRPEFLMIGAAGPTSVSVEMTEPDTYRETSRSGMKHNFTSTKYIRGMATDF